jgi:hypothetical protein
MVVGSDSTITHDDIMTRSLLLLLAVAIPAVGSGCQFGRKMTAQREMPPNAVLLADVDDSQLGDQKKEQRKSGADVASSPSRVPRQTVGAKSANGETAPRGVANIDRERAKDRATEAAEPKPRNGWATLLGPFQPARAIPVPRDDLPEPHEPSADETTPVSTEKDFDLFDGF